MPQAGSPDYPIVAVKVTGWRRDDDGASMTLAKSQDQEGRLPPGVPTPPAPAGAPDAGAGPAPGRRVRPNLFRTSAFRMVAAFMGLFALSGILLIGFIYWTTIRVIDRQSDATIDAEIVGLVEQYRNGLLAGLVQSIRDRTDGSRRSGNIYLLVAADGHALAGNLRDWPDVVPDDEGWLEFRIENLRNPELGPSLARARAFRLTGDYRLLVGRDLTERRQFQRIILWSLLSSLGVIVVLGLAGGLLVSRNLLHRLEAINRTSADILYGNLDRRVPLRGSGDEFDRLAENLNLMLQQIEQLMTGMREVTDNVAHDLRSPLNRLRNRLELMLMQRGPDDEARQELEQSIGEVDALLGTFNALLSIAQAEAGAGRTARAPIDLGDLARDAADLYQPLAEEKGLQFAQHYAAGQIVQGDRHLLSQAVANLLDNAIKYTPAGGRVTIAVVAGAAAPRLIIADTGPGIPPAERERALQRFVRLEGSRSSPGSGLGLSLAAAVAKLHRARLVLEDNGPGLRVVIDFPAY